MSNPILDDSGMHSAQYQAGMLQELLAEGSPVQQTMLQKFLHRLWWMVARSDTKPTRFMLASTASMWSAFLLLPGDTMERPGFVYLRQVFPEYAELCWTVIWLLVAIGLWWRIFSSSDQKVLPVLVNAYAFMVFSYSSIAILASRPFPFPAGIATDLACALAAAWVLVRTHINSGPGWHND